MIKTIVIHLEFEDNKEVSQDKQLEINLISKSQQRRMFAIAGGQEQVVRQVIGEHGLTSTSQVSREKYQDICNRIEKLSSELKEA